MKILGMVEDRALIVVLMDTQFIQGAKDTYAALNEKEKEGLKKRGAEMAHSSKWREWDGSQERLFMIILNFRREKVNQITNSFEDNVKLLEMNGYMAVISIYEVKDPNRNISGSKIFTAGSKPLSEWIKFKLTNDKKTSVNEMEASRLMEEFKKS
jgi:hypothetical protein